jgi:hypothetical protein
VAAGLAEAVERLGFVGPVAGLAEQDQGLVQVAGRLPVAALPQIDEAQVVQRGRFGTPVTGLDGGAGDAARRGLGPT